MPLNYVPGTGSISPDLMIIGEAPGKHENDEQIPFVGATGNIINEMLFKAGMSRHSCWLTNVVKFQPPFNDFDNLKLINVDLSVSIESLWQDEIRKLKPKCILAVGNEALKATTGFDGILNYRGSILTAKDGITKVVPTVHPAALFKQNSSENPDTTGKGGLAWTYIKLIEHDFRRAVEESSTRELRLPQRELQIAHNSLDLYRFFKKYEKLDTASMDIESVNCVPVCVGFAFNRHHAISIPLFGTVGKHQISDMGNRELNEVWRVVYQQLARLKLIGHNLKYDEFKLMLLGFSDRKFKTMNVYSDTLIKTRVIFPELPSKKLNVLSSIWTREPYYKEEGKEFKFGKTKIDQLLLYNAKDCAVEKEIDEEMEQDLDDLGARYNVNLRSYYYDYQMRKHKAYLRMENVGFDVDLERKAELKRTYKALRIFQQGKLDELVGHEVNVKSAPQVYDLLYKELRFKALKRDPTSEDAIVRILNNHAKKDEDKAILISLLETRRIRDQESRYINFEPDYDSTCKSAYNIISTETCRSSTGILKKPLRPTKIGLAFHTIAAHGRLAKDIKSMFRVRKGKVFVKADSSQAEARVVMVLAKQWEALSAIDKIDIHRRTAALILGLTNRLDLTLDRLDFIDDLAKDGPERFCGKKTRHAGNYKMGKGEFMINFNTDAQKFDIPMSISEWKAGEMIKKFREADDRLERNFWYDIEECIKSTRCIVDPFGGIRIFNGRLDDSTFKEGYANIPQRTVGHLVQKAMLSINDEIGPDSDGYFIGEKHDELVMEVPENEAVLYGKLLKKYMESPIDFSTHCSLARDYTLTIPCDVEYSDTHLGSFRKLVLH